MTSEMLSKVENLAKATVRFVEYRDAGPCVACREFDGVRLVEVMMPPFPPCREEQEVWDFSDAERLVLCEACVRSAARVIGVYRDPGDDPDVQASRAATQAAEARRVDLLLEVEELDRQIRALA